MMARLTHHRLVARIVCAALLAAAPGLPPAQTRPPATPPNPPPPNTTTSPPPHTHRPLTNPLFYDEFSDPDLIRVGDWFYMTGTTMHAMPGLPVMRSKDLVNWEFLSYAAPKLDFGPAFRLEDGKGIYGQGIWAPSLRFHNGTFYIFTNINRRATQVYSATDPRGPWKHHEMRRGLHDLSVLFDDDGKAYAVWGHQAMQVARLNDDLTDIVPGTEKTLFDKDAGMGEGAHFYKIGGKYFILSANYAGGFRMPAARADNVYGPYEVNQAISKGEGFGMARGYRLKDGNPPFVIDPPNPASKDATSLHQGGIVLTPEGEWWGFSMMDYNSVGRLLSLSPVTWSDGWPYFGLPGNPGRNPRTWVKPKTAVAQPIRVPYERSDDFSGGKLKPIWQWNHVPVEDKWSLTQRPGFLRLHALKATSFWDARNSLTQRAVGPISSPTVALDLAGMKEGDIAGLGLLNLPYATLGVEKTAEGLNLALFDQTSGQTTRIPLDARRIWLRADCDFLTEQASFSYSTDGKHFVDIGGAWTMVFQLKTFQGVRYALFNYNLNGAEGGYADFDSVDIAQPMPRGLMRAIPFGKAISLTSYKAETGLAVTGEKLAASAPAIFKVKDMGLGRVALASGVRYLAVDKEGGVSLQAGKPGVAHSFQWMETPTGELILMSIANNRYLRIDPKTGEVAANSPGPLPDGSDGVRFIWSHAKAN